MPSASHRLDSSFDGPEVACALVSVAGKILYL
jgi:hypothetical protein